MRFRHPDGSTVHLAYCTNVHPAEDLDGVIRQLDSCAALVRKELGTSILGVGLWLAAPLAARLRESATDLARLRETLDRNQLEVVTVNGFPYAGFHDEVVGKKVYLPDWTQPERLRYTLDLAAVLTELLPGDAAYGSISTLPLAWREPWTPDHETAARSAFARLEHELGLIERRTGRRIRIALEPEPGCVVETVAQAVQWLPRSDRIGLCVDTCHLAVQFEDPAVVRTGSIVKSQLSAALQLADPADRHVLDEFAEPKFLHQTREQGAGGVDNLDEVGALPGTGPWRVHFHTPVHAPPRPPLTGTTDILEDCLTQLVGGPSPLTHHLEAETYTWSVLPAAPATVPELAAGIAAELAWSRDRLEALGLEALG